MSREGSANIVWHPATVTKQDRQKRAGHKSCVLWFTGLSGAGKSTLANAVEHELHQRGLASYILDGDNIRHGLNRGLGFGAEDRRENIRRIGEVAKLFVDAGVITLTAFISPYREDRELARRLVEAGEFVEVYVKCSLDECERRDVKGLYQKARSGEIGQFTGISAPYEEPVQAELVIESDKQTIEEAVQIVLTYLEKHNIL
ncbi:adenylyl-sulfate kinase [Brevibacillus sp. NPDC003359]|uniref:adenylyl-sulfate kinase n=1 Tax=unclassified Brevibacillus TaxID=2684853 RepID=UPI0036BFA128